jgi:hypothetical protein
LSTAQADAQATHDPEDKDPAHKKIQTISGANEKKPTKPEDSISEAAPKSEMDQLKEMLQKLPPVEPGHIPDPEEIQQNTEIKSLFIRVSNS